MPHHLSDSGIGRVERTASSEKCQALLMLLDPTDVIPSSRLQRFAG
jgi:hypothetical protein